MINLKVDSAYPEDQGFGRARLDPETMLQLHAVPGDLVYIEGKKKTCAKVWRMTVKDWNQEMIRIDNYIRSNAGVSIGDRVTISKADNVIPAACVILAPPEDLPKEKWISDSNTAAKAKLSDRPVTKGDSIPLYSGPFLQSQPVTYKVVQLEPEDACIITRDTEIIFSDMPEEGFEGMRLISYEDIGGLKGELQNVRETIEFPLRHPELFRKLGIDPPKGVLLYGPPGTGKTLIAKAVANECEAHFISIAGPEIISKYYGESEQRLREIFEEAEENAPSIIFIDEFDSIAPKREDVTGEVERRVVAQLLTMMDGLEERGDVVVIGATNRVDSIDPALRRPGRFDREIEISVPSEDDRLEILRIHTRGMPLEGENRIIAKSKECAEVKASDKKKKDKLDAELKGITDEIEKNREKMLLELASRTNGFVGADLAALSREAGMRALRRYLPLIDMDSDEIPQDILESMEVEFKDFTMALQEVRPSAMREAFIEVPRVKWSDVGGLSEVKEEVRESVEYPLTRKDKYRERGIEAPKGVLLYGPPGTGKTLIAKAVANESGANFIPVRGPELISKWVGESERAVREIFRKARQLAPSIVFFDELDSLAPARTGGDETHIMENVLNQILTEFDGLEELNGVVIMGATNRPDIIDPALLRAGRFDRLLYIGEPSEQSRMRILQIHSKYMPLENSELEDLVEQTDKYSEKALEEVFAAVSRKMDFSISREVTKKDFTAALKGIKKCSESERMSIDKRRHFIVENLIKNGLYIQDKKRDALIADTAKKTEGYVGSDLALLCREAAVSAMRADRPRVGKSDFEAALKKVHPMMNDVVKEQYSKMQQYFKGGLPQKLQPVEYQ